MEVRLVRLVLLLVAVVGAVVAKPDQSIPIYWGSAGPMAAARVELVVCAQASDGHWQLISGPLSPDGRADPRETSPLQISAAGYQEQQFTKADILEGRAILQPRRQRTWIGLGLLGFSLAGAFWSVRSPKAEPEPSPSTPSGQQIDERPINLGQIGPYHIISRLGQGATSEVFLAADRRAQGESRVALKLLSLQASSERHFRSRFEREAELCQRMQHPRLVRTFAWGVHSQPDGEQLWMAQQYIPGQTLSSWISPHGLHPTQARRLLIQICEGLEYAHSLGVFHRDLKPDNIFSNSKGELLIGDFGMAKDSDLQTITQEGSVLGTPVYMAPEQVEGLKVGDGRADLYSLGVIGYELLAGKPPFEGSMIAVLSAHLSQAPKPILQIRPKTPLALSQFIMRLLEKNPAHRYASASEALLVLRSLGNPSS